MSITEDDGALDPIINCDSKGFLLSNGFQFDNNDFPHKQLDGMEYGHK